MGTGTRTRATTRPAPGPLRALALPALLVAWLVAKQMIVTSEFGLEPGNFVPIATAGLTVVLVAGVSIGRGRVLLSAWLLLTAVVTAICWIDLVYFREFRTVASVRSLPFAWQLFDVRDAWLPLTRASDAWLAADLLAMAAALFAPRRALAVWLGPVAGRIRLVAAAAGVLVVASSVLLFPYLFAPTMHHAWLVKKVGLLNYHVIDLATVASRTVVRMTDDAEAVGDAVDWLERRRREDAENPLRGVARGRNVIVLQLESFHAFLLGLEVEGREVTPSLNRLAAEGATFPNFFDQTNQGRTADADLLANCSLLPMARGAVYFNYAENDFYCMPSVLRDHGYRAVALHGMPDDFWNYSEVYPRIGFERFYSERDFELDDLVGLGLSDRSFLRQSRALLTGLQEPFHAFLITLTSHMPFRFENLPHTFDAGALDGTEAADYLNAVHYTDAAIGEFLRSLAVDGLLERSVVVVYGDHSGIRRAMSGFETLLRIPPGREDLWLRAERGLPLIVRLPGGTAAGARPRPAGAVDIAPTLLGLLGLPADETAFMGSDLLATGESTVALATGTAIGDGLMFVRDPLASGEACLEFATGDPLETARCAEIAREAAEQLRISRSIVRRDLVPAIRRQLARPRAPADRSPLP